MKLTKEKIIFFSVWLLLFAFVFGLLGGKEILSGDESRVAGIAAEMLLTGDWLVPKLNGAPFLEYPPFYYWCTALSYRIFGITDFAAKLPTTLAACALLILSYQFSRKLELSPKQAMLAPFFLLFSGQFFVEMHRCRVDMMLALMIALAVFAFYRGEKANKTAVKILWWTFFTFALTGGGYTKGLLGVMLPGSIIGTWLIVRDCQQKRVSPHSYLSAISGGVIALVLVAIWYCLLREKLGAKYFHDAVWVNNFGRFSGAQGDHTEMWWYYWEKVPTLFLPWLPLLLVALWNACKAVWGQKKDLLLLLLCFLLIPFGIFNLASAKRVVYLLPLTLPAAILCAWQIANFPARFKLRFPHSKLAATIFLAVIVIGFGCLDVFQSIKNKREESLRALFTHCRDLEQQGYEITLANVPERTYGAYYFYLHHAGRRVSLDAPLKEKECRIFRSRTQPVEFNDYHGVLIRHQ